MGIRTRIAFPIHLAIAVHLLMAPPASAQGPRTPLAGYTLATWTEKDGLNSSYIQAITQDQDGYLWLGTTLGLIRFDGTRFVSWEPGQGQGLPATDVNCLIAASDGSLWMSFGQGGGVSRLLAGQLTNYGPNDHLPPGPVSALLEDRHGVVWAVSSLGISRFLHDHWEGLAGQSGLPAKQTVYSLFEDRLGQLWAATAGGVFRRPPGASGFQLFPSAPPLVRAFAQGDDGAIWVTTHNQEIVALEDPARSPRSRPLQRSANGLRIIRDRKGNLWVATLGLGIVRVPAAMAWTEQPLEHITEAQGLSSNVVWALFEDREGNIWTGTQGGLNRFSDTAIAHIPTYGEGSVNQLVRTVDLTADGHVWVGTNHGLYELEDGRPRYYGPHDGLPTAGVRALHGDRDGTLWIATESGLARFDQNRFRSIRLNHQLNQINSLTRDFAGDLWLTDLNQGLFRLHRDRLIPVSLGPDAASPGSISVLADSAGRLWVGCSDGRFARYDHERDRFESFFGARRIPSRIPPAIYQDAQGAVFLGTADGLDRLKDGRLLTIGSANGFPAGNVTSILEDGKGALWIATSAGVVRVAQDQFDKLAADPSVKIQYQLYDPSDGLPGLPFSLNGYPTGVRSQNGRLWFVTTKGLAVIDADRVATKPSPRVLIESVVARGQSFDPRQTASVPGGSSTLQIDYTSLPLATAAQARFRYMLEGFDSTWVDAGKRRQAFYTNLPPRAYRFRVSAGADGSWDSPDATLQFSVEPLFYQTRWFYLFCTMVVVLGSAVTWQRRVRGMRRQFSMVLQERSRISREIHDTLLQSLVGLALRLEVLANGSTTSGSPIREQLLGFRRDVQDYIREARASVLNLRSPALQTGDLPSAIRMMGEKLTKDRRVRFEFALPEGSWRCPAGIEDQLLPIAHEAVANAARHADAETIRLELGLERSSVRLRVSDDGRGFDVDRTVGQQSAGDHVGLANMQERARLAGGELQIISSPGGGTTIVAVFPLRSAAETRAS